MAEKSAPLPAKSSVEPKGEAEQGARDPAQLIAEQRQIEKVRKHYLALIKKNKELGTFIGDKAEKLSITFMSEGRLLVKPSEEVLAPAKNDEDRTKLQKKIIAALVSAEDKFQKERHDQVINLAA